MQPFEKVEQRTTAPIFAVHLALQSRASCWMLTRIFVVTAALMPLVNPAAQAIPVPAHTESLSAIGGQITEIQPVRIPVADNVTGVETQVSLQFTLNGCVDSLLPVLSYSEVRGRRVTLYVTALNAHNPESDITRCVAMPQASAQVSVPGDLDCVDRGGERGSDGRSRRWDSSSDRPTRRSAIALLER